MVVRLENISPHKIINAKVKGDVSENFIGKLGLTQENPLYS